MLRMRKIHPSQEETVMNNDKYLNGFNIKLTRRR